MRPKKYPLEPLRRLKKDRAEAKTRELGTAIASRESIQKKRETAEAEREAERARANLVREQERAALREGRALRSQSGARGCVGAAHDRGGCRAWTRRRGEIQSAEEKARAGEAKAQADVAVARAEVEATARHEQRFWSTVRKAEESREEEAVAEARPSKRPR